MVPGRGALVSRLGLAAARQAAATLGRNAETTLSKLETAGLVVWRTDLPDLTPPMRTLLDVEDVITLSEWQPPYACQVIPNAMTGGRSLELIAVADAGVREARLLREVMGGSLNVEVDEAKGLLLRVWREE